MAKEAKAVEKTEVAPQPTVEKNKQLNQNKRYQSGKLKIELII